MAKDISAVHRLDDAAIDMKIGAADRAGSHLDDRVVAIFDLGSGTSSQRMSALPCHAKAFMERYLSH
jgi:uncharacterized protein (UPF0262 family)